MMVHHSRQSKLEAVFNEKQPLVLKTVTGWSLADQHYVLGDVPHQL
jgi:hypothetical protein